MKNYDPEIIAGQLACPHGELAEETAEFMEKGNASLYRMTYANLGLFPGARVLEIGPANGAFVKDLFRLNEDTRYTAIDLSKEMVASATENNKAFVSSGSAIFLHGDFTTYPFAKGSFDIIFSINTLYFWKDPALQADRLISLLRPGGQLAITIREASSMQKMPFTRFGFTLYDEGGLVRLFEKLLDLRVVKEQETLQTPDGNPVELQNLCVFGRVAKNR
jgi:SAM-dependent methyltransferase